MFVKYIMTDDNDYRGNVKLIVQNTSGQQIAYCSVETADADMTELTSTEVQTVKDKTNGIWMSLRDELTLKVDNYADYIRQSHLEVGHDTIFLEYTQVENALRQWQSEGSDPNAIPPDIQTWMDATGQSLSWVVDDIERAISDYRDAITAIRRVRLLGKQTLQSCVEANLNTEYDTIIADLKALEGSPNDPNV